MILNIFHSRCLFFICLFDAKEAYAATDFSFFIHDEICKAFKCNYVKWKKAFVVFKCVSFASVYFLLLKF